MLWQLYSLLLCAWSSTALHFYLDSDETKCFIEELPSETVVDGHYRAFVFDPQSTIYVLDNTLGIDVEIEEVDSGHIVTQTRGPSDGKFTFTSHEAGDHTICVSTNWTTSAFKASSHIKLYLDVAVGSTKADLEQDRSHVTELVRRLRDLNMKMEEIQREQQYQREREASFRDLSESTNSKAVWYTIAQIGVLVAVCFWQIRHLKNFFRESR